MPGDISLASSSAGNYFLLTKHIIAPVLNSVGDPKIPVSVLPPGLSCLSPKSLQAGTGVKENVICPSANADHPRSHDHISLRPAAGGRCPATYRNGPARAPSKAKGLIS